ncbi:MAG: monovalent cation/H(+) antiporter subunit G [Nitriliruptoraceae bacterium]
MSILTYVLISAGIAFMVVSAIGLVNLPGLYTRAHAVAKSETFALMLVLAGLFFHPAIDLSSAVRLALVLLFSMAANPTAVHALLRAARRAGVQPWKLSEETTTATLSEGDEPDGETDGGDGQEPR